MKTQREWRYIRDRVTERQIKVNIEIFRQRGRKKENQINRDIQRHTETYRDIQRHTESERQTDRQAGKQTDRHIDTDK